MKRAKITIFRTPVLTAALRLLALLGLQLTGWRAVGRPPLEAKYVLIGVPHTSNWDFLVMLAMVLVLRLELHWMGKHTLFPWYIRWLMVYLGGIPIDRGSPQNTVQQMAEVFRRSDRMVLLITPEGTRGRVERWKAGFYHIAHGVGVPVVLGYLHVPGREAGIGPLFTPTGNYEADLGEIQSFYRDKVGFHPELSSGCTGQ